MDMKIQADFIAKCEEYKGFGDVVTIVIGADAGGGFHSVIALRYHEQLAAIKASRHHPLHFAYQEIRCYSKIPPNGLVVLAGAQDFRASMEPMRPLLGIPDSMVFYIRKEFMLDHLKAQLVPSLPVTTEVPLPPSREGKAKTRKKNTKRRTQRKESLPSTSTAPASCVIPSGPEVMEIYPRRYGLNSFPFSLLGDPTQRTFHAAAIATCLAHIYGDGKSLRGRAPRLGLPNAIWEHSIMPLCSLRDMHAMRLTVSWFPPIDYTLVYKRDLAKSWSLKADEKLPTTTDAYNIIYRECCAFSGLEAMSIDVRPHWSLPPPIPLKQTFEVDPLPRGAHAVLAAVWISANLDDMSVHGRGDYHKGVGSTISRIMAVVTHCILPPACPSLPLGVVVNYLAQLAKWNLVKTGQATVILSQGTRDAITVYDSRVVIPLDLTTSYRCFDGAVISPDDALSYAKSMYVLYDGSRVALFPLQHQEKSWVYMDHTGGGAASGGGAHDVHLPPSEDIDGDDDYVEGHE